MIKPRSYVYEIDIIRFLAALSVVGFHLGYLDGAVDFTPIWPVTWFGWIGVEVFFVISGFVIANSANGSSPTKFFKGRALRLYPAVWCCGTITLVILVASGLSFSELLPSYLRSIALIPKGPWIDDVYWTLAVEIAFYTLIFGLLCAGIFSYLSYILLALTAFSSLCLSILAFQDWQLVEHANVFLARHGCFFAVGSWLWISTMRPLLLWERAGISIAIAACVVEIILRGMEFLPIQIGNNSWLAAPVIVWTFAIVCIFIFSRQKFALPDAKTKVIRTLGLMTYPLYLVHHVVGHAIMRGAISIGVDKWLALTVSILSTILISWIVCTFFEPAIRNALRGYPRPVLTSAS